MADNTRILSSIAQCEDPERLRILLKRAQDNGVAEVAEAVFRKLVSIVPAERPGTAAHDFWQVVNAFELTLTQERGTTTRLSRTRQKVARVGVIQTLRDWALSDRETDGFQMLLDRGMAELTGEAIVLRHAGRFEPEVVKA